MLGGPLAITTNGLGIGSFSGLSLTGPTGGHTLRFTAGSASVVTGVVILLPGPVSASTSTANVPSKGKKDLATVITIQARDQSGNPVTTGGSAVVVTVSGSNHAGPFTATDNGDGSYTATYTPTKKGKDTIVITLNGSSIAGSPFTSDVK